MSQDKELPFWEHFRELGFRLKKVFYAWIVTMILLMALPANIMDIFSGPQAFAGIYRPLIAKILSLIKEYILNSPLTGNIKIMSILGSISAGIELYLLGAFWLSIIIIAPFLTHQIYKFVEPGLYEHEKEILKHYGVWFVALFVAGAIFGFFVVSPIVIWAFVIFAVWFEAEPVVFIVDIYNTVLMTTVFTGFAFTFPIIMLVLIRLGIISTKWIEKNRLVFYIIIFIISAIITPDGGPVADIILAAPVIILTEVALRIGKKYERERAST